MPGPLKLFILHSEMAVILRNECNLIPSVCLFSLIDLIFCMIFQRGLRHLDHTVRNTEPMSDYGFSSKLNNNL